MVLQFPVVSLGLLTNFIDNKRGAGARCLWLGLLFVRVTGQRRGFRRSQRPVPTNLNYGLIFFILNALALET